jgi:four helix bundle protein|tara:strand:+ start:996 stop:1385 length:390 start_codon:yes stop_codon:yes gene_type:complete
MTRDYTQLKIWKAAHSITVDLYKLTDEFPSSEKFGLISQIRRSSASIGMNIAEGCGQNTTALTRRYLHISLGSIKELEYQILLAKDLGFIDKETYDTLIKRIQSLGKMTSSFIFKMPQQLLSNAQRQLN